VHEYAQYLLPPRTRICELSRARTNIVCVRTNKYPSPGRSDIARRSALYHTGRRIAGNAAWMFSWARLLSTPRRQNKNRTNEPLYPTDTYHLPGTQLLRRRAQKIIFWSSFPRQPKIFCTRESFATYQKISALSQKKISKSNVGTKWKNVSWS